MEKVEAVFKKNSNVEQIWVYGNSFESQLVAVVVPNEVHTLRPLFCRPACCKHSPHMPWSAHAPWSTTTQGACLPPG